MLLYTQVRITLKANADKRKDVEDRRFNRISSQPQRQVPQTPYRREDEAGAQGAPCGLQSGQGVSPPPYLLAQRAAGEDGEG